MTFGYPREATLGCFVPVYPERGWRMPLDNLKDQGNTTEQGEDCRPRESPDFLRP